nr:hypothetical protein [Candidatus Burkholderia verschuerenii]
MPAIGLNHHQYTIFVVAFDESAIILRRGAPTRFVAGCEARSVGTRPANPLFTQLLGSPLRILPAVFRARIETEFVPGIRHRAAQKVDSRRALVLAHENLETFLQSIPPRKSAYTFHQRANERSDSRMDITDIRHLVVSATMIRDA